MKVTKEMVVAWKAMCSCAKPPTFSAISKMFGVDRSTVSNAVRGRHYKSHVGDADRVVVAHQLREIANRIESGEFSLG